MVRNKSRFKFELSILHPIPGALLFLPNSGWMPPPTEMSAPRISGTWIDAVRRASVSAGPFLANEVRGVDRAGTVVFDVSVCKVS